MKATRRVVLALFACLLLPLALHAAPQTFANDAEFLASLSLPAAKPMSESSIESSCSANCFGAGTASCSGGSSCYAVNRNCAAGEPGHAVCYGVTSAWCDPCPEPVEPGCQTMCEATCGGPGMGFCNGVGDCICY